MPWLKIDERFFLNHKIMQAGLEPRALYLSGLCHCAGELTDGFVAAALVRKLAMLADVEDYAAAAARLVELNLWEPTEGGYRIHDYLKYNPSRQQVEHTKEVRAEAGKAGGTASGKVRGEAKPKQIASPIVEPSFKHDEAKTNPVPVPVPRESTLNPEVVLTETSAPGGAVPPAEPAPEPVAVVKTVPAPKPPVYSDRFERAFWAHYPACSRRRDKAGAYQAWKRAGLDTAPPDAVQAVTDSLAAWSASHEWRKDDGAYIPLPATFLNGRQWEAPAPPAAASPRASPNGSNGHRPGPLSTLDKIKLKLGENGNDGGAGPIEAVYSVAPSRQRPDRADPGLLARPG